MELCKKSLGIFLTLRYSHQAPRSCTSIFHCSDFRFPFKIRTYLPSSPRRANHTLMGIIKTIPTILQIGYNLRIQVCYLAVSGQPQAYLKTHILLNYTSQIFNILCNQDSISLVLLNNIVNILENCFL